MEFKQDNDDAPMIGEYISALANSAALLGKQYGYVVWGVENDTHTVKGTCFKPSAARHKQQELESWLLQKTVPKIHFRFFEFAAANEQPVVILEIQAAAHTPVQFDGIEFIRVGSYKKKLREFPEKERELWRVFDRVPFEQQFAAQNLDAGEVLKLLDYPAYFDLTDQPLPEGREAILAALTADQMIERNDSGHWSVTNLGAILFAKRLQDFQALGRKAVRLIQYRGNNKLETIREEVPMYPELALRELVANAVIHQDFNLSGTGPMIELFGNRLEITNPGVPLVDTQRFLDSPPRSRNEALASFMRRIGVCEERGQWN